LLVLALHANEGFCWGRISSALTKFENVQPSKDVNPDSFENELELLGNMIAFSDSNNTISVKCENGKTIPIFDYSNNLPQNWSSHHTILTFDTTGEGNVRLFIYDSGDFNKSVSVDIRFGAFICGCAFNTPYPKLVDDVEIRSAPAFIWEVSPNPITSQVFTVKMYKPLADIEPDISMYNLIGQLVKTFKIKSVESQFETTGLAEGLYILKISNGIETNEKRIYIGKKQ
jgi:hypothetical protein